MNKNPTQPVRAGCCSGPTVDRSWAGLGLAAALRCEQSCLRGFLARAEGTGCSAARGCWSEVWRSFLPTWWCGGVVGGEGAPLAAGLVCAERTVVLEAGRQACVQCSAVRTFWSSWCSQLCSRTACGSSVARPAWSGPHVWLQLGSRPAGHAVCCVPWM
jgi:hypothetical protein